MRRWPDKDLAKLARRAVKQGWVVRRLSGGHVRFQSPAGVVVVAAFTSSDHRGLKNTAARLRRAGLSL